MYLRLGKVIDVQANQIYLLWLDGNGYASGLNPTLAAGGNGWGIVAMPNIGDIAVCAFQEGNLPVIIGYLANPLQLPAVEAGQLVIVHQSGNKIEFLGDNILHVGGVDITLDSGKKVDGVKVASHYHHDPVSGNTSGPVNP